jgi:hypothetical protein
MVMEVPTRTDTACGSKKAPKTDPQSIVASLGQSA